MPVVDTNRPPMLYRYSSRQWLERALTTGEFRLRPMLDESAPARNAGTVHGAGARAATASGFLTLAMTRQWNPDLFEHFGSADCCLVISNPEEFGERLHRAVQRALPSWAGIDAAISYGAASPLGKAFSKPRELAGESEWMFAWRPTQPALTLNPIVIRMGSLESIAELREKVVS